MLKQMKKSKKYTSIVKKKRVKFIIRSDLVDREFAHHDDCLIWNPNELNEKLFEPLRREDDLP